MTLHVSTAKQFITLFIHKFQKEETTALAAQLAYSFLMSVFPLLLFMLTLLPYLSVQTNQVRSLIQHFAPGGTGNVIGNNVHSLLTHPHGGLLVVSILVALWSASNGVSALFRAVNRTYEVTPTRSFIKDKLLAIALTLGMVVIVAIALLLPVFGRVILHAIQSLVPLPTWMTVIYQVVSWAFSMALAVIVITTIYCVAPHKKIRFRKTFWGALIATLAWHLISLGFSFYVSNFGHYSRTYGALGGVIVLMIWFYLTGLILIVGGQVNATLRQMHIVEP